MSAYDVPVSCQNLSDRFFRLKVHFSRRKSACKVSLYENLHRHSCNVVRHSLPYLTLHKWWVGDIPYYLKFSVKKTYPLCKNGDFQSMLARSTSAITPSEKSFNISNRKSTKSFPIPMTLRWTSCVAPKPPKVAQKRKVAVYILNDNLR